MSMIRRGPSLPGCLLVVIALGVGCGGDGGSGATDTSSPPSEIPPDPADPEPTNPEPTDPSCGVEFSGTFDAIQQTVFARHGCTAEACHGSAASGGLDLSPAVAHANLLEVDSVGSEFPRIKPGDNDRSYLWRKLAAKTTPDAVSVGGSPMPIGDSTLSVDELELLREWIKAGAPAEGTVDNTQQLIDGCLPPIEPILIRPLDPPPPGEGLQIVMPEYDLRAGREREVCFAQAYDLTDQVPAEFQNPAGTHFRISASDLRQDPQSHHLILFGAGQADPADFGDFFCAGGENDGAPCDPEDPHGCGDGLCATEAVDALACIGVGEGGITTRERVMVAQQSNEVQELDGGVYAEIPIRGVWLWNSHAFNLTTKDTRMHARLNYTFAKSQFTRVRRIFASDMNFSQSVPPFGSQTICNDLTLPRGARVFNLISHTHKRGKRFWVDMPDGTQIYENFVYNDPNNQYYDPPLAFDSKDPVQRTLTFCAYYENGLGSDGSMDVETVKRRSTTPANARSMCRPVACTAGNVGAACNGAGDDATCDSSPGAGDGECDACVLGGGVTTEDEMFILIGAYYVALAGDAN